MYLNCLPKLKTDIRNQAKTKVRQITKEQQEELFQQKRKEGEDFYKKAQIL